MKLVHWPLMGGLLHLVQRGGAWAGPIKGLMFYLLNRLVNHFVGYASYVVISDVIMTEDEMSQSQEAKNRTIAWIGLAYTAIVLNKPFFDSR